MKHVDPDQVSLLRVPLPCGFAPKIGCGTLARPLLLALERTPGITEAWLNQAGTLLAVVGSKTFTAKRRARVVKAALEAEDILSEELQGQARAAALEDFLAGADWLRRTDVDSTQQPRSGHHRRASGKASPKKSGSVRTSGPLIGGCDYSIL
jgi:hypothetical protein